MSWYTRACIGNHMCTCASLQVRVWVFTTYVARVGLQQLGDLGGVFERLPCWHFARMGSPVDLFVWVTGACG